MSNTVMTNTVITDTPWVPSLPRCRHQRHATAVAHPFTSASP